MKGRLAAMLGTVVAVVVLLVLASPTIATDASVVTVRTPSTTPTAYLPLVSPPEVAAPAPPLSPEEIEAEFVTRLNDLRAAQGLSVLEVDGGLVGVARRWAVDMAAAGAISHRRDLAEVAPRDDWVRIGENVGVGGTVVSLHDAFVASPAHYANMVDPDWSLVGVGVEVVDDSIYVAVNFLEVQK